MELVPSTEPFEFHVIGSDETIVLHVGDKTILVSVGLDEIHIEAFTEEAHYGVIHVSA